ncbi:MAG: hypothetical protein JXA64_03920 [Candidatus Fermentibacteraceae bacterium]|nr:hypothetical protein [Candidatus Fermentibacteraceae bacterium]MBN2608239.1 hypothetical protein [Candidatus Fermentibacteraceae bacterium]
MLKLLLATVVLIAAQSSAQDPARGTSSCGGLSGYLFLPSSEVIDWGCLRVQGRIDYIDQSDYRDPFLLLPFSVTWGMTDNFELGGEIPFYLDDPSDSDHFLGDITAGCGWLYETARGGSAIVLRGMLRLPTGVSGRDRGAELDLGASTSTTFRLFKLQAAASYVLNGGDNPFDEKIRDYMRFSMGGASYVSEDVQLVFAMDGTTWGELGLSGSGVFYSFDPFALFGAVRVGLSGREEATLSAGVSWEGSGF